MRARITTVVILVLPLLFFGTALGGEGVEVRITNDGTTDVLVTVYDLNTSPKRVVLTNARINGFTSVPVSLVGDASGKAKLSWTATSADSASPKCDHEDAVAGNTDSVKVHADSSCSA
jgi:hypothetical protein